MTTIPCIISLLSTRHSTFHPHTMRRLINRSYVSKLFYRRIPIMNAESSTSNILLRYTSSKAITEKGEKTSATDTGTGVGSKAQDNTVIDETTFKGKVSAMWKKYGVVAIGTYFGLYVCTLGSLFFVLDFDIINSSSVGFDPAETITKVCDTVATVTGYEALPAFIRKHPDVGTFAIAWVMTKFTEPLRLGITVAIVPKIASLLRNYRADREVKRSNP